jgi:hypothetical protein
MPGRRVSHSESRWALLLPTIVRCNGTLQSGQRCRREAVDGSVVCDIHGGAAPQVRRRRRATDHDRRPSGPDAGQDDGGHRGAVRGPRQDLLDRAGLVAAQVHKIVPTTDDPLLRFFDGLLSDPSNLKPIGPDDHGWPQEMRQGREPAPAIEGYPTDSPEPAPEPEEILEAEIVGPERRALAVTAPRPASERWSRPARSTGSRASDRGEAT